MNDQPDSVGDHIKISQLNGLIDAAGVDGAREILDAFWRSTQEMLDQLAAEIAEKNLVKAGQTSHAIKGMAANVGAARLSDTVSDLENACRANDHDQVSSKMPQAQADFVAAQNLLLDHLSKAS